MVPLNPPAPPTRDIVMVPLNPPQPSITPAQVWADIRSMAAETVKFTVTQNVKLYANHAQGHNVPPGHGPCFHFAHTMALGLAAWQNNTKEPIVIKYHLFEVKPALLPPVYGQPVNAGGHIIVQVIHGNYSDFYDGGSPALGYGNLGNDQGQVNPKTIEKYVQQKGLIPIAIFPHQ